MAAVGVKGLKSVIRLHGGMSHRDATKLRSLDRSSCLAVNVAGSECEVLVYDARVMLMTTSVIH